MDKRRGDFERELSNWPGVEYQFDERRRKHNRLILFFNEQSRFVVYAKTASDCRAFMNQIAELRRACRVMGAERKGQAA